ncbi:TRAP transporter small permease [Alcaligenes sp. 13f]|uniref:TRAP transporter small permease subunit n=1 Tax=Alcaligenes sp. 13f TaxID=2841924 RepID=UPI001CF67D88|nr:TRAP transporter small permease [Alcaligenes sp. 13f]MCB4321468.1 TRAP transporter small permease [Alcaligenes sp. 13f]
MSNVTSAVDGRIPPGAEGQSEFMLRLLSMVRMIARGGLWFGGGVITAAALLIGLDIMLRAGAGMAIDGTDELARFALAISTTWALAGALLDRAHIRVDTAYAQFPGAARLVMDLMGLVAFFIMFGLIFYYGLELISQSWVSAARSTSALQIPMVIPQVVWLAGIGVFLMTDLVLLAVALYLIATRRAQAAAVLTGMKSADEEVREELLAADAMHKLGGLSS